MTFAQLNLWFSRMKIFTIGMWFEFLCKASLIFLPKSDLYPLLTILRFGRYIWCFECIRTWDFSSLLFIIHHYIIIRLFVSPTKVDLVSTLAQLMRYVKLCWWINSVLFFPLNFNASLYGVVRSWTLPFVVFLSGRFN